MSDKSAKIEFRRNGAIMRDGLRVGWIERRYGYPLWTIRFTPASHIEQKTGRYFSHLRDAKQAVRMALEGT